MRDAETILGIIHDRGKRGLPLEDVYRQLFNPELYLLAYGKIYRNQGAMTPGATQETVDGMSMEKIQQIIEDVRYERHRWQPARRLYIEKKNPTKKRPLRIPTWSDKLLQEVIRLIFEAYYEPQFSDHSHGFRANRGCHTALREIYQKWKGTVWFLEGDISQCFDTLDHEILMSILAEKIHDNRFLRLIRNLLQAGYLEEWKYNATLSGSPQGGIVSPILANIYLDRLDKFVEQTLLTAHNYGEKRKTNPEYQNLVQKTRRREKKGEKEEALALKKQAQTLPSKALHDPDFRRLHYVRYADDFLLGFIGSKAEAEEIKRNLKEFLKEKLHLELSEEKTLITHARSEPARYLGYEVIVLQDDQCRCKTTSGIYRNKRGINGGIGFRVPREVLETKIKRYQRHGKPIHLTERENDSPFAIVAGYQQEYRGIVNYYRMAYNLSRFGKLRWIMKESLLKTLAGKYKTSISEILKRYRTTIQTDQGLREVLQVTVERGEGRKSLVAIWGNVSLSWNIQATLDDRPYRIWNKRTEVVERLLAEECELCGSTEGVEVHHIRALKDLHQKGQEEKPEWVKMMAARHRKTLVVCHECHVGEKGIHPGRYDGRSLRK
jgi:group II intron reverse transcriptase/maturase